MKNELILIIPVLYRILKFTSAQAILQSPFPWVSECVDGHLLLYTLSKLLPDTNVPHTVDVPVCDTLFIN